MSDFPPRTQRAGAFRVSRLLAMSFCCLVLIKTVSAQSAAETAGATSLAGTAAASAKPMAMPAGIPSAAPQSSPHIVASTNAPSVETNRQALEAKAGPDAARLLLRSAPSQAQVWIEAKPVGTTPLLLIVPPGKYKIEFRGPRQEHGQREVALLSRETREVAVKLEQLYPTRIPAR
jgi:hypothetical protein